MKNLVILHLESISRERLTNFESAFPNLRALMRKSVVFDNYFSSATSTQMAVTYLWHGNDFELDASPAFQGMRPANVARNIFSVLHDRGYKTGVVALNAFHEQMPTELDSWPRNLPPVWGTADFPELFAKLEALADAPPFALYVWNLVTHIEHSRALVPFSTGLTDQVQRACELADNAIGELVALLDRKDLLQSTTIVTFGDHGDDFWTHGFKGGMIHGTEPYTDVIWAPLSIFDPDLPPGRSDNLASTIDIAPTCLALLGIDEPASFPHTGTSLFARTQTAVFSQNCTASQRDNAAFDIAAAFSATDEAYSLLVSSHGLEFYAYRLDPGNHCNLLHFFDLTESGRLALRPSSTGAAHFRAAMLDNPQNLDSVRRHFTELRNALSARVAAKRAFVVSRGGDGANMLDQRCFDAINRDGQEAFFGRRRTALMSNVEDMARLPSHRPTGELLAEATPAHHAGRDAAAVPAGEEMIARVPGDLEAARAAGEAQIVPLPDRPRFDEVTADVRRMIAEGSLELRFFGSDHARTGFGARSISVVMPLHNHGQFVERALNSVAMQSLKPSQLVVVDDGSDDDGAARVEAWARQLSLPVTLVRQANAGVDQALNRGLALARGEILVLISSDDSFAPDRLRVMAAALGRGAMLAFSDTEFIDADDRPCSNLHVETLRREIAAAGRYPNLLYALLRRNVAVSTGNLVFRRELLPMIGGFAPLAVCHDWDFVLAATYAGQIALVPSRLYRRRVHRGNTFDDRPSARMAESQWVLQRFLAPIGRHPWLRAGGARRFVEFARSIGLGELLPEANH